MQKPFNGMSVGQKFYRRMVDGSTRLEWVRMKVDALELTREVASSFKITEVARKARMLNCVIITSPNRTDGYYDYIEPTDLVFVATKYVC